MTRKSTRQCTGITVFVLALVALAGCGASQGTSSGVHAIAVAGDPAPGLPDGYVFEGIDPNYTIGASGQVLFSGSANTARGSSRDRKKVLWFGEPAALRPIVEVGQPIPGTEDITVADFSALPRIVTQSGAAAFVVQPSAAKRGYPQQTLMAFHDGALDTVIASGDSVPTPEGPGTLLSINQYVMTDAGLLLMGTYARRQTALWFWNFSTLELVIAEGTEVSVGNFVCKIRALESTTLDLNRSGFALFRASMFGNQCKYGGMLGWDYKSGSRMALTMNREPVASGASEYFQSVSGDARISDAGEIALHAILYDISSASSARSVTMLQTVASGPSVGLLDKTTPIANAPDLSLTHVIHDNGMAPIGNGELVHFVRNNRDRMILRTRLDRQSTHALIAHTGTTVDDAVAARIGNGAANRSGNVVFTSFVDDDRPGGTYQQQLWLAERDGELTRLAYPGLAVTGRDGATIDRIEASIQSYEPVMHNTQGGRSRTLADNDSFLFAGRIKQDTQHVNALFVAQF